MRTSVSSALRLTVHGLSALGIALAVLSCGLVVSFDEYGRGHGTRSFDAGAGGPIPTDATLASLTISGGALSPAFQPTTLEYTMHVRSAGIPPGGPPAALSQTIATATATLPDARITVAGKSVASGTASAPLDLGLGDNAPLDITVTSPDQQTQVHYAVSISVARSYDYIKASDSQQGAAFSRGALAFSGDTLAVGRGPGGPDKPGGQITGRGSVSVFTRAGAAWSQQAHIDIDADLGNTDAPSIALDGDTLAVRAGSVGIPVIYVFTRRGASWSQEATLEFPAVSQDPFDQGMFGSIALSGSTLAAGANDVDGSSVYVFTRSGTTWSQQTPLHLPLAKPPVDPNMPPILPGPGPGMILPVSVALSGDRLAVGVPNDWSAARGIGGDPSDISAEAAGAVHVFVRTGATWSQEAYIKASNTRANAHFGNAVALSGATLVVGSESESSNALGVGGDQTDTSTESGAVYVFSRSPTAWSQEAYLKPTVTSGLTRPVSFGHSVALAGNTVAVGAPGDSGSGRDAAGAVFGFTRNGSTWSPYAYLQAPFPAPYNSFGDSLAVSTDTLAVGSPFDGSSATGINGDEQNQGAPGSGAVHVY